MIQGLVHPTGRKTPGVWPSRRIREIGSESAWPEGRCLRSGESGISGYDRKSESDMKMSSGKKTLIAMVH